MERQLRCMYKNTAGFGDANIRAERSRRQTLHKQKQDRTRNFLQRRKVTVDPSPPSPPKILTRREKLLIWKAKKDELLRIERAQKKPPFKVGAVSQPICPLQNLSNLPIPKSMKKTTAKKIPIDQPTHLLKQTAASQALAALCGPSNGSPLKNQRVTRLQAKLASENNQRSAKKTNTVNKKTGPVRAMSFAPANHAFKAPSNLTVPLTPTMLRRYTRTEVSKNHTPKWPMMSGVSPLKSHTDTESVTPKKGGSARKKTNTNTQTMENSSATAEDGKPTGEEVPPLVPVPVVETPPSVAAPVVVENVERTPSKRRSGKLDLKPTPTKRRSVRLATATPKPVVERAIPEEDDVDVGQLIAKKVSRLSIHSPTRMVDCFPSPEEIKEGMLPAQFSPFIVTGRGANRHKHRRSCGADVKPVDQEELMELERAKQVKHFRSLLETETNRLLELCDKWEKVRDSSEEVLPSLAEDLIFGTVGQTRLLTKDKFQQFKRLIDKFESGASSEEKMTADDLIGFWEMIQITVKGVDNRFLQLDGLQSRGWKEEVKIVARKPKAASQPRKVDVKPELRAQVNARIREAVAAARKKQQERSKLNASKDETQKTFDGGFFRIQSPKRDSSESSSPKSGLCTGPPITPGLQPRKSLLQQVLTNSARRSLKSPSVSEVGTRIKASLLGRRVSMSRTEEEQETAPRPQPVTTATPGRGILKSSNKSVKKNKVSFLPTIEKHDISSPLASDDVEGRKENSNNSLRRSLRFSVTSKNDSNTANTVPKPSLLPMRDSPMSPKPLECGDLMSWESP